MIANAWFASITTDWMATDNLGIIILFPVFICLAISVILLAFVSSSNYLKTFFSSKPIVFVGEISYSLYLYHILVQVIIDKVFYSYLSSIEDFAVQSYLRAVISLFPTIIISVLMYKLVEKPALAWVDRFR
jgi:peptidoglycan/LPS O-acetylase OafA/YrhL